VGIGSDFDGGGGVEGCFDVSEMANVTIDDFVKSHAAILSLNS